MLLSFKKQCSLLILKLHKCKKYWVRDIVKNIQFHFSKNYFLFMCLWVYMLHVCTHLWKLKGGIKFPRPGDTGNCEPSDSQLRIKFQTLWKSSKYSQPLSNPFSIPPPTLYLWGYNSRCWYDLSNLCFYMFFCRTSYFIYRNPYLGLIR